jgi:hypothetical protein
MRCHFSECAAVISEIRAIAENVRTYGSVKPGNPGIAMSTPAALHVLAAQMESDMRALAQLDLTIGRHFSTAPGELQTREFPELITAATAATPHPIGVDIRVAELRAAARRLRAVIDRYRAAVATRSSDAHASVLAAEVVRIEHFATAME